MTRKTSLLLASVTAAILAAPIALAAPGDPAGDAPAAGAPREGRFHRRAQVRRAMRFLRALELSDAQKAQVRDARAAAEPVREDARAKVRAILEEARKGERTEATREQTRAAVKAVREAARSQVEPSAKRLVDALTADQRAKLAERAAKHGKALDDAKLLRRFERVLLAPERRGRKGDAR